MRKSIILLLHVGYWLTYLILIAFIIFAVTLNRTNNPWLPSHTQLITASNIYFFVMFSFINALLGFYSFYFVLFPKYLMHKKITRLILFGLLAAIASQLVSSIIMAAIDPGPRLTLLSFLVLTVVMSFIPLIHGMIALVMRGFVSWYGDIKLKAELQEKNHTMELALIRAQLNPHFLFNTINNIDMLIQKDAGKASDFLNKLSDMMRFMLYETKEHKITLAKELSYIEKYVELQKIRTSNPSYVTYEVNGETGNWTIEPMLFIPFIENAFKHSGNKMLQNAIKIQFHIEEGRISFECENAYTAASGLNTEHKGLGNELIQKRLALLYPDKHQLSVIDTHGVYKINLLLLA